MKSEPRLIVISNINSYEFEKLYLEHGDTLSCPCSTITIPYNIFVSSTITYHPICSSIFIDQQWIEALYLPDASRYGVADFRTTAKSQVKTINPIRFNSIIVLSLSFNYWQVFVHFLKISFLNIVMI